MVFSLPPPMAISSPVPGAWETGGQSLFCEHAELFSGIFPRSGTMRNGRLYPRVQQGLPIGGTGSSSLLRAEIPLLPTPTSHEAKDDRIGRSERPGYGTELPNAIAPLLATPNARDWKGVPSWKGQKSLPRDVSLEGQWGQYEPVIRRWEKILECTAPFPAVPGKTAPRLNPEFSEWMMGLPSGWVTSVPGLSRREQFIAIGNGVCPQQASMALKFLLNLPVN